MSQKFGAYFRGLSGVRRLAAAFTSRRLIRLELDDSAEASFRAKKREQAPAAAAAGYLVPHLARRTALERWMAKIEYEVTREGLVYLLLVVAILVAALNTGNNLLFIILACLLSGMVASGILSRIVLSDVELSIALPERLFAERRVESIVTLENRKRFFPSFAMTVSTASSRPSKDRAVRGLPARPVPGLGAYFPFIPRRSSVTRRVELTFPRRGRYTQDAVRLSTKFPFGLLRKSRLLSACEEILVLPNVRPTAEFEEIFPLLAGELESFTRGHAHDLYALRDYHETDTVRHVDWKASAKARQLKVREFTREDDRRVVLVFDRRLPQRDPGSLARFEKAVGLAASLAWHFYETDAQVEFVTQGFRTPAAPTGEIIYPILETLALVEPILLASEVADDLLAHLASEDRGFKVIVTGVPRSHVPAELWLSSHVTLIDSLL